MIVLEGPDGGGKSTLADKIRMVTGWKIIKSEGPEKEPGEILERIDRYHAAGTSLIFDRHPIISHAVYGIIPGRPKTKIPKEMSKRFYDMKPLIIYVRSISPEKAIVNQEFDTPERVEEYKNHYNELVVTYDHWACVRAKMIYRMGEDDELILQACRLHMHLTDKH